MMKYTLQKQMIQTGAVLCGLAVALGAFGAHELRERLAPQDLETFKTAVTYHFLHALAILVIGNMMRRLDEKYARQLFYAFLLGIIFFSGSLYVVSTRSFTFGENIAWFGAITPLGGIAFLGGWYLLAFRAYKSGAESESERHHRQHKSSDKSKSSEETLKHSDSK